MNERKVNISFNQQVNIVITIFLLMAGIEAFNLFTDRYLNQFGLLPRNIDTLYGIILSPLLHVSLVHFLSNIVPLLIFSLLMMQYGVKQFFLVTIYCILLSGTLVWLFGRNSMHIGASGLIYGYFGYLLLAGMLSQKIKLILISLVVGFTYGGLIFGVLPHLKNVSWESHLFGFFSGLSCALLWNRNSDTSPAN